MPNSGGDLDTFSNTDVTNEISDKSDKLISQTVPEKIQNETEKSVTDMLESEKKNSEIIENTTNENNDEDVIEMEEETDLDSEPKKDDWIDLLGSGRILKKIISKGTPDTRPARGEKCTLSYICKLEDGTEVEVAESLKINLGECDVIQGLDVCLGLMDVDEKCVLKIHPKLAYGERGCPPNVPPNATLIYEVHMEKSDPEDVIEEMSVMERKKMGNKKRERGNWWYQRGEHALAIQCYRKALDYLDEVEGGVTGPLSEDGERPEVTDADLQGLLEDRVSVCNNMAAAQIKLELYDQALTSLQTVLRCQPENVKALYRKAKIYIAKNDLSTSLKCLEKAKELQPGDAIIQKELAGVQGMMQKQKNSEREYARRMFGNQKDSRTNLDGGSASKKSKLAIWATIGVSAAVGLAGVAAYKLKYA